jgi:hypothetical protein
MANGVTRPAVPAFGASGARRYLGTATLESVCVGQAIFETSFLAALAFAASRCVEGAT